MKISRSLLVATGLASVALLGGALYMQHVLHQLPCPLCVIQRYAFFGIALISLIAAALPQKPNLLRIGAGLGALTALSGAGVSIYHIWVQAHPTVSCGIDPLETSLNKLPTAKLLPFIFQADGLCTTSYPPLLGLSLPQWTLICFLSLAATLSLITFQRKRSSINEQH